MRRTWPVWDGVVDLDRQQVQRDGGDTPLTPQEVALFTALVAAGGRTVSREALLVDVWGFPKAVASRAVDHAMARLRAKVERDPSQPDFLLGVRGVGYRYQAPDELHGLIGRTADHARLVHMLHESRRVTLVGPAGVGKTALATAWASDQVPMACLEPVGPEGVLPAIARTLGVSLSPHAGAAVLLGRAMTERGITTLILDATEHVTELVSELLRTWAVAAPGLTVLTTSHGPLGTPGERVLTLAPLDVTDGSTLLAARLAQHGAPHAQRPEQLADLVRRVDGLPLAIELLAARARVVGASDWPALADDLEALRGRGKDASVQHAVERTWQWLDPELQRTLTCASLWVGMAPLSDLGSLLDLTPAALQDRLDALATRAVWRVPSGPLGALRGVARRHASPTQVVRQARCVASAALDVDEHLAAADRVLAHEPALAIDLLLSVVRASLSSGPWMGARADLCVAWSEAHAHRLGEALLLRGAVRTVSGDHAGAKDDLRRAAETPDTRAEALARQGWLAAVQGRTDDAERWLQDALVLARATSDVVTEAMVQVRWGGARHFAGDPAGALSHLQAAVGLYEALDDDIQASRASSSVGLMWLELGQPERAEAALLRALEADRAQGMGAAVAQHLLNLGGTALDANRPEDAIRWLEDAEQAARDVGDLALAAQARMSKGLGMLMQGDAHGAIQHLTVARTLLGDADRPVLLALAWAWSAVAMHRTGDGAEAQRAIDTAEAVAGTALPEVVRDALTVCKACVQGVSQVERDRAPSLVRAAIRIAR